MPQQREEICENTTDKRGDGALIRRGLLKMKHIGQTMTKESAHAETNRDRLHTTGRKDNADRGAGSPSFTDKETYPPRIGAKYKVSD